MGNCMSKSRARESTTSSNLPLNIDIPRTPTTQMSFPRSPCTPNLPTFSPGQDLPSVNEVVVSSFAGDEPDPIEGGISRPTPARPNIHRYSQLIDPSQLEDHIRSPSGNLLSGSTYALRDDRPLSIRERQQRIREQMLLQQQRSAEARKSSRKAAKRVSSTKSCKQGKDQTCFGCDDD